MDIRGLAMVSLRSPAAEAWVACPPKSPLFRGDAEVLRYIAFSRLLDAIVNRTFGIPIIAYFDDFGGNAPLRHWPRDP